MIELIYGNDGKIDTKIKNGPYIDTENKEDVVYETAPDDVVNIIQQRYNSLSLCINNTKGVFDLIAFIIPTINSGTDDYTAAGLARNLKTDDRNGKMYEIMVDKKKNADSLIDMENTKFLTDVGFAEYAASRLMDNVKQFSLGHVDVEIPKENIYKLVAKIFEANAALSAIGSASFMLSESDKVQFNAKSIAVYNKIIKFLPQNIRENLTFVGRLDTSIYQPENITDYKLLAYSMDNVTNTPKECIDIFNENDTTVPKRFTEMAKKIVDLADEERNNLFELLTNEFEKYAKGNGLKAEEYEYIFEKLNEWNLESKGGKRIELCIQDWLNEENMEYINRFPYFLKYIKDRLGEDITAFVNTIIKEIKKCKSIIELKSLYEVYVDLCEKFECDVNEIQKTAKSQFLELLKKSTDIDNLIDNASLYEKYSDIFLDNEFNEIFYDLFCKMIASINEITNVILYADKILKLDITNIFKERQLDLDLYIRECFSGIVEKETSNVTKSVEKLRKYRELKSAYGKYLINKPETTHFENILNSCINEKIDSLTDKVEEEIKQEFIDEANIAIKSVGDFSESGFDIFKSFIDKWEELNRFVNKYIHKCHKYSYMKNYIDKLYDNYIDGMKIFVINIMKIEGIDEELIISYEKNGERVVGYLEKLKREKYNDQNESIDEILEIFQDIKQILDIKNFSKNQNNTVKIVKFIESYFSSERKLNNDKITFDKNYNKILKKYSSEFNTVKAKHKKALIREIERIIDQNNINNQNAKETIYEFFEINSDNDKNIDNRININGRDKNDNNHKRSNYIEAKNNKKKGIIRSIFPFFQNNNGDTPKKKKK